MGKRSFFVAALVCAGLAAHAKAAVVTLDFEGLGNLQSIGNYYNGGGGTNYGVDFSSNALAGIEASAGGTANASNLPSGVTLMAFLTGTASTLNYSAGFDTGFSFYYSAADAGTITVYDGLNATGSVLATLNIAVTPDPYTVWVPVGVTFSGTARSIDFGGTANFIGFDNITFGSDTPTPPSNPVPLPAAAWMGITSLGAAALLARKRKIA